MGTGDMQEAPYTGRPRMGFTGGVSYKTRELLKHYNILLELYQRLENVSAVIFEAMKDSTQFTAVQSGLNDKMAIVETIQKKSQEIAALKKDIRLSEYEKTEVRKAESALTSAFNRIVEQEDRSHILLQKQGMKLSRI
jgi:hypothetical protein